MEEEKKKIEINNIFGAIAFLVLGLLLLATLIVVQDSHAKVSFVEDQIYLINNDLNYLRTSDIQMAKYISTNSEALVFLSGCLKTGEDANRNLVNLVCKGAQ